MRDNTRDDDSTERTEIEKDEIPAYMPLEPVCEATVTIDLTREEYARLAALHAASLAAGGDVPLETYVVNNVAGQYRLVVDSEPVDTQAHLDDVGGTGSAGESGGDRA